MKYTFTVVFSFCVLRLLAQSNNPFLLPYRSAENKYYWKNNIAAKDYWQQDVHYEIKAVIDDKNDVADGQFYKLTYRNNSPGELKELFFHLYDNAFQPGSYYHDLWNGNKMVPKFGKKEAQKLGNITSGWQVNGKDVKTELDNTILKVYLDQPLKPGESLEVTCNFKSYWDTGSMRRRSKTYTTFGYKHYDGVHWYPVICVYDSHFGWHTDQHLDKEYYADFGSFDVELTFPQEYVVEATGTLINKDEVLPDSLRKKLDIKNFRDKPFNSAPSVITPKVEGKSKTWKYYGVNVHNFAFTADPLYRIGEIDLPANPGSEPVKVITLAQEHHAAKWQQSGDFTARLIQIYSRDFGSYIWPKIIVADANDGMEYPMLTLDGGVYPQHQYLLAHEVGHMWFYGMLGSNETYRASMDEGFTQFLTIWSMDKITGARRFNPAPSKYIQKHTDSLVNRYERLYTAYLADVWSGYDEPLNTHSAGFNGGIRQSGGYRLVYNKTGVMLYNLKYVLGDSLFLSAMQHYVQKWTGKHPYPEDFRNAITEYAKTDLTWFFDQWLETTKYIDYKVDKVKLVTSGTVAARRKMKDIKNDTGTYTYELTFRRLGRMQMPLDFTVTTADGKKSDYHVPNNWFLKKTDAKVLPKWYGWDILNPTYTTTIQVRGKLKDLQIDTSHQLADIDLTNNSWRNKETWELDHRVTNAPNWEKKRNFWRPDLWWNQYDGLQTGISSRGDYFGQNYWQESSFWWNSSLAQSHIPEANKHDYRNVAFYFSNKYNLSKYWKQLFVQSEGHRNAGLWKFKVGFEKTFRRQDLRNPRYTKIAVQHGIMYRPSQTDVLYLLYPDYWSVNQVNSYVDFAVQRYYPLRKGAGEFTLEARTSGIASDFNYSYLQFTNIHAYTFGKFELKSRLYARAGFGNTPVESALYLAGAAPEQLYNHRLTRAAGFVPNDWLGYGAGTNHFQTGGGLNIRGYAGYLAPYEYGNAQVVNNVGKSGASLSFELDFDRFIPMKPGKYTKYFHMDTYLFHDMGILSYTVPYETSQKLGNLRTSSGVGTALTVKFGYLNIKPLVIRFDMPMLLNTPPAGENYFQFRYVMGVSRSF